MKKMYLVFLFTVLSLSCSVGGLTLGSALTPTPAFTSTKTYTPVPTATPVTPTLTFTSTPTLIGLKSPTPTPEDTATSVVSATPPIVFVTPNTATATVQMEGFISVRTSVNEFYKGRKCDPSAVKFTAQVLDQNRVAHVLLFVRFRGINSGTPSEWVSFSMDTIGAGTYVRDLYSDEIKNDAFYMTAWIDYQFVATTSDGTKIGGTPVFKERLKMLPCTATPTPTLGTITP
ncbi:MAG: hypothetical protein IH588_12060 [Anaerolineales bacterium]|nr:hypothetical protein [Anaerolineales bacterium]